MMRTGSGNNNNNSMDRGEVIMCIGRTGDVCFFSFSLVAVVMHHQSNKFLVAWVWINANIWILNVCRLLAFLCCLRRL